MKRFIRDHPKLTYWSVVITFVAFVVFAWLVFSNSVKGETQWPLLEQVKSTAIVNPSIKELSKGHYDNEHITWTIFYREDFFIPWEIYSMNHRTWKATVLWEDTIDGVIRLQKRWDCGATPDHIFGFRWGCTWGPQEELTPAEFETWKEYFKKDLEAMAVNKLSSFDAARGYGQVMFPDLELMDLSFRGID